MNSAVATVSARVAGEPIAMDTVVATVAGEVSAAHGATPEFAAAYWLTSSHSFAHPAITIGRMFSATVAGIAPDSAPGFILAQLLAAGLGIGCFATSTPGTGPPLDPRRPVRRPARR